MDQRTEPVLTLRFIPGQDGSFMPRYLKFAAGCVTMNMEYDKILEEGSERLFHQNNYDPILFRRDFADYYLSFVL